MDCSVCFLGGVGEEPPPLPSPPIAALLVFEGLLFNWSVCSAGSGLRVLLPAPLDGELRDDDFLGDVLVGDEGLFGDLFFSDSRVSHSVARYVTIDLSSGLSTLTSVK